MVKKKIAQSFEIGPGHKDAAKKKKIYEKGKSTTNPPRKGDLSKEDWSSAAFG